jgi:excinuclease UvrABC ATPase subunit
MKRSIDVVGADANNLADVQLAIPFHAVTAIVGPSGSGKSSLVEDTIASEAAERMHRFLGIDVHGLRRREVRAYIGELPPTLFVGQRAFRASSRTTVATCTGIHDLLRRLFVRYSDPVAEDIGAPVPEPSPHVFAEWLSRYGAGRAIILGGAGSERADHGSAGHRPPLGSRAQRGDHT